MDVRNISNHGNIDRNGERAQRLGPKRQEPTVILPRADDAKISAAGRDAAAAVERLADRARGDDGDRDALVEAARQKLLSGELDDTATLRSAAQGLLDRDFLSA